MHGGLFPMTGKCCICERKAAEPKGTLLYFLPNGKSMWLCGRKECDEAYENGTTKNKEKSE